jgi:hypothetical protein
VLWLAFRPCLATLKRQQAEAERDKTNLYKHLTRLDPDAPENASVVAGLTLRLREAEATAQGLEEALDSARAELEAATERRNWLVAFRAYAAQHQGRLDSLTPLEKRAILLALRVWVRVAPMDAPTRLWIVFGTRYLPGAAPPLAPATAAAGASKRPRVWVDFALDAPIFSYTEQMLTHEGREPAPSFAYPPMTARDWERAGYRDEADFTMREVTATDATKLTVLPDGPEATRGSSRTPPAASRPGRPPPPAHRPPPGCQRTAPM